MVWLFVLAVILFMFWIVAVITHFVISAAIHVVLGIAILLFIVGLITGRRSKV